MAKIFIALEMDSERIKRRILFNLGKLQNKNSVTVKEAFKKDQNDKG